MPRVRPARRQVGLAQLGFAETRWVCRRAQPGTAPAATLAVMLAVVSRTALIGLIRLLIRSLRPPDNPGRNEFDQVSGRERDEHTEQRRHLGATKLNPTTSPVQVSHPRRRAAGTSTLDASALQPISDARYLLDHPGTQRPRTVRR